MKDCSHFAKHFGKSFLSLSLFCSITSKTICEKIPTNFYVIHILMEDAFYGYLNERKEEDIKFIVTRLSAHKKILENDNGYAANCARLTGGCSLTSIIVIMSSPFPCCSTGAVVSVTTTVRRITWLENGKMLQNMRLTLFIIQCLQQRDPS